MGHPGMDDVAARLDAVDRRLDAAESGLARALDELALLRLVASYFPLVDSGRAGAVADLWVSDGRYDVDSTVYDGADGIRAMVRGDEHQQLIAWGCGHVPGLPHVALHGETAVVTGHSQLLVRSRRPGRFTCVRVTANRWECERRGGVDEPSRGWRVVRRTARVVDESGAHQALLAGAEGPDAHPADPSTTAAGQS